MSKIFIDPFARLIGTLFLWLHQIVENYGLSLIALSLLINILLFPFYYLAEKVEDKEKAIQEKMKPKIDEFKSIYKGYEQHLYISNVYRLNNYHPIYALRGLVSLLIQVPFFMGAYQFLSTYSGFEGVSFLFLKDLAMPDALLKLGQVSINLLPFLMTAINLLSSYLYTKDASKQEKLTLLLMAIFFLVILYDSPSSLLIYWTFNNVFSLVKNFKKYQETKNQEKVKVLS